VIRRGVHALARKNFPRRRIIDWGYDDLWQADVVEIRTHVSTMAITT